MKKYNYVVVFSRGCFFFHCYIAIFILLQMRHGIMSEISIPHFANPELRKLAETKIGEITNAVTACIAQAIEATTLFHVDYENVPTDSKFPTI